MSNRTWFYASEGQPRGPLPEAQLRDLIARGMVRADTLVWTEGMAGWQKAGEIPGLIPGAGAPPAFPQPGGPPPVAASASYGGGQLSIDFGIWEFIWRTIVFAVASAFVIPLPWMLVWYLKWLVPCVQVPGRPNLSFEGTAMTIVPWFFGAVVLIIAMSMLGIRSLNLLVFLVEIALYWLFLKWLVANIASNGQLLGLSFTGSFWAYLGWTLLAVVSFITIIGWAWVYAAWTRWVCQNIQGARHEVTFNGTGLEFLWRGIVTFIGIAFLIPIPWVYRWMMRWIASQTALVQRGTQPGV
ncbi:GYF domain-containing protein [Bradyrhizobium sp. ISRA443]|uniref:GYF domain-containing protein n=1 Tax=unclassified Bradyrhizobium TaxID=2631580 RepID=UPI00247A9C35|nr:MULTISPECIES: GYF domain-containing protein [unclassified Bradyrhizobium]WGR99505.1 GYF domain-containing protein [Bradyrhizobium sp. ISRA436]WGS06395.1 GYF domain-containing protein [Bradyrhizobium sp. ISRA437]WGS13279.1 GYF domain-containing protein [Bradyrhizobium sp. ISRA443]